MNTFDTTPGTQNYDAWLVRPLTEFPETHEAFLEHLVAWAILGASTHNTQPWRFIVEPYASLVRFCLDPYWVLPASDKVGRQAVISMGCALENFLRAADYYGAPCEVEYPLVTEGYPHSLVIVRVGTPTTIGHDSHTIELMGKRRMNRKRFNPKRKVPSEIIEEIKKMVNELGLTVHMISDWPTRIVMANAQYGADQIVLSMTNFRNELGKFFLPNDTLEKRGMPGATYGLDDEMSEKIHEELLKKGAFDAYLAEAFPAGDLEAFKTAPLIVVVSIPEDIPYFWIAAGRALEQIALTAQDEDLGFSVHAAMTEVAFSNEALKIRFMSSERPTVICRLGYLPPDETIPPHSPRVSVKEVTEFKKTKMEGKRP